MKQFYSVLFSLNNTDNYQNFVMDINEVLNLRSTEINLVTNLLNNLVMRPEQKVLDKLFDKIHSEEI